MMTPIPPGSPSQGGGIAALSPAGNYCPPPPFPRPRAGVTSHLPRPAGEAGRGCRDQLALAPVGPAEAA